MTKSEWEELQKRLGITVFDVNYRMVSVEETEELFRSLFKIKNDKETSKKE